MIPVDVSVLDLFDALVRSETFAWRHVETTLRVDDDISLVELTTLRAVSSVGPQARVTDLVQRLGISVGAASKAVDRLEAAGLARRSPAPEDRRSSLIAVTDDGAAVLAAGESAMLRTLQPLIESAGLDVPQTAAALTRLLDTIQGATR